MADQRVRYIIEFDTKTGVGQIQNLDGQILKTANSAKQLSSQLGSVVSGKNGKGGLDQLKNASGGATSSILELGRVIQDAPYGIRGMANNITQLASSIVFTTKAAGGFRGALSALGTAFMGPGGILIGISLVVSILDDLYGANKKAEGSIDDITDAIEKENDELIRNNKLLKERIKNLKAFLETPIISQKFLEIYTRGLKETTQQEALLVELAERLKQAGVDNVDVITDENLLQSTRVQIAMNLLGIEEQRLLLADARQRYDQGEFGALKEIVNIQEYILTLQRSNETMIGNIVELEEKRVKGKRKQRKEAEEDIKVGDGVYWTKEDYNEARELEFQEQQYQLDSRRNFYAQARIDASQANNDLLADYIAHKEEIMLLDTEEASFERFEAEKELSMLRMELSRNELDHELMIIDEKRRAQEQYIGYMYSISSILGSLAGENEELAKVALALEKGAAIADIIVTTIASNAKIQAEGAALAIPTAGASEIAAKALITKNNVAAGLSIAAILASTIAQGRAAGRSPSSVSTGRGGGDTTFRPEFNVVGASGQNQLAATVAGQVNPPLRAYVVYDDLRTAQEIDLNAVTSASI